MKCGDLVTLKKSTVNYGGRSLNGIPCLILEILSDCEHCIILSQGSLWTARLSQLEMIDEEG
jgi:hypothetical protein